jgi:uncharacterized membrane protein
MPEILETIKILFEESFPWLGAFIAPAILYFRWLEKRKKRERERIIEDKLDYLIELGGGAWDSKSKKSRKTVPPSLKRSLLGFCAAILRRTYHYLKRRMTMQNINWYTLIASLVGALKLSLQPFGIEIPDQQYNELANGAAALITIIGVFLSHRKPAQAQQPTALPNPPYHPESFK